MMSVRKNTEVVLAFIGTAVPDEAAFHGPAFNRAGQMFQEELIRSISEAGLAPSITFTIEPLPSFPRSKRLFGRTGPATLRRGHHVWMLPFVNIQPFKALSAGLSVFIALLAWAWRHRTNPRVIHVVNLTMPPGVFVWLAGRLTRSRVTVSVLDIWRPGALVPDSWLWRMDFGMQRWLLPRFDGHAVVSRAIADDLIPGRRVCVLEGGIDPGRFDQTIRPSSGRKTSTFRMVLAGSLESFNGFELVAAAMALLPAEFELVVAGGGSLAARAEECAARDPRIVFRGFLSFEDVLRVYASADLLLNARVTKAIDTRYFFPSKLMELLASGTPVLSTCTGQVESEYGGVLYLLHDETPEALAQRIQAIAAMEPAERLAVGMRARAFMLREKTWRRQGEKFVRYVDSVLVDVPR